MKDLRRNEFIDMLEMAELLFEANEKFIKCDIPTLGSVTYYPKANKLQINKSNSWEENGFEFVKNILSNTIKHNPYVEINPNKSVVKIKEVKSDDELRDEFAGLAMQGILSNKEYALCLSGNTILPNPDHLANLSYGIADAMMKQRKL